MSYFRDRDPREVVAALGVVTVAALCWLAHLMAQWSGVLNGVR